MRAVVTVIGKDNVGILHKVSGICAEMGGNVIEVTQSVLQDMFAMIMLVDISSLNSDFSELVDRRLSAMSLDFPFTQCTRTSSTRCTTYKTTGERKLINA